MAIKCFGVGKLNNDKEFRDFIEEARVFLGYSKQTYFFDISI
jgi:hypothetical protein